MSSGDFPGQLLDGERFVWTGRPGQGVRFTSRDILLIPFSLMWGGFAVFWEWSVIQSSAPVFFWLFGVPFVLFGLYFIVGRFAVDVWLRGKTRYAVTSRRILIARPPPFGNFVSLNLNRLPDVELQEDTTGRGTLRFGPAIPYAGYAGRGGFAILAPALDPTPQFIDIEKARSVFDQIQRAIASAA